MPVVRTLRVRVDWVQFPAPRRRHFERMYLEGRGENFVDTVFRA